jgi:hypothetical protein
VEVGGIDFSVWKLQLKAKKVSSYKFYSDLNFGISVIDDSSNAKLSICNEVKKCGLLIDRGSDL